MLTRGATKRLIQEETTSEQATDLEAASTHSPSLNTLICCRDLMEETMAARAAPLRKKLERLLCKTLRNRDKLARQRAEENPATTDLETLKETHANLEQHKQDYEALSQELYEVESKPTATEEDEVKM